MWGWHLTVWSALGRLHCWAVETRAYLVPTEDRLRVAVLTAQARLLSCCREDAAAEGSGSIRGGDRHAIARNVACGARSTANGRRWLRECGFGLPRDPCCWRQDAAKRESYLLLLARRSHHAPTPALRTPQYRRPCPNMTGLVVLSSWSCPSPGAGASPLSKRKSTCTFCGPFG